MIKKIIVNNPSHLATTSYKNLKDLQGNLKTLTKDNLEKLKQSIIRYGIFVPKFVWIENNKNYWIEDGHQTIKALAALEKENYIIPDIPYVKVECENKKDAAEKLLQINSRYGIINPETTFFEDFDIDLDFINDIEIPELDIKLEELESKIVEDEVPEPPIEPLSKTGDLWICGKHRILCGDATKEADIVKLMDGKKADCILTDPPYGINIVKVDKVGASAFTKFGKGKREKWVSANTYPVINGDDKPFNPAHLLNIAPKIMLFGANYYADKLPISSGWLVWDKKQEDAARNTYADCELLWTNFNISPRIYRCVWQGLIKEEEQGVKRQHPTQKPIKLCADILSDFTEEGELIADFYLGSGTTWISCVISNRIFYGCEIEPKYVDIAITRWINWMLKNDRENEIKILRNGKEFDYKMFI